ARERFEVHIALATGAWSPQNVDEIPRRFDGNVDRAEFSWPPRTPKLAVQRRSHPMAGRHDPATAVMIAAAIVALMAPAAAVAATTAYDVVSDVRIPMADGVSLDSDEYVPTTGCPCPTILVQTPYRKSGAGVSEGNTIF